MSLSNIPRDKVMFINDILSYSDINQVIEGVKVYSPKMKGLVVVGMDENGMTMLWSAGLSQPELVYLAETIRQSVFKQDEYSEIEDGE